MMTKEELEKLSEKELSKIVRYQCDLFCGCLAVGVANHMFGLRPLPFMIYLDLGVNLLAFSYFLFSIYLWFKINLRYQYFGSKKWFVINTIIHFTICLIFILDAYFCISWEKIGNAYVGDYHLFPFLIEFIIAMVYYIIYCQKILHPASKIHWRKFKSRSNQEYQNKLCVLHTKFLIGHYQNLVNYYANLKGYQGEITFDATVNDDLIDIIIYRDETNELIAVNALSEELDWRGKRLCRNVKSSLYRDADLEKVCEALNNFKINLY